MSSELAPLIAEGMVLAVMAGGQQEALEALEVNGAYQCFGRYFDTATEPIHTFSQRLTDAKSTYRDAPPERLRHCFELNTRKLDHTLESRHKPLYISLLGDITGISAAADDDGSFVALASGIFFDEKTNRYPFSHLDLEAFREYVEVLVQYSAVDEVYPEEQLLILGEIELYAHITATPVDPVDVLKDALKAVLPLRSGDLYSKRVASMLLGFDEAGDTYFKSLLNRLRDSDRVISTQERSFDKIGAIAQNGVHTFEERESDRWKHLAEKKAMFPVGASEYEAFTAMLAEKRQGSDFGHATLIAASQLLEDALQNHFSAEGIGQDLLVDLVRRGELDFDVQLLLSRLLRLGKITPDTLITPDTEQKLLLQLAGAVGYFASKRPA